MNYIKSILLITLFTLGLSQNEFSQGPYGTGYFDTAGPFSLVDLNIMPVGDINLDQIVNIQDIVLTVGSILGTITLSEDELDIADINNDNIIDILDIVQLVNSILNPLPPEWDFETNWTGSDIYIFLQYDPNTANSVGMWNSNTKADFLNNSPDNVHYFFLSARTYAYNDVSNMKDEFNEVLANFSEEDQSHWANHLHFVPVRTYDFGNWITESINGVYGFAIDGFQKIRQLGYLGNPASFTGTYLSYVAHEAVYLNYELETFLPTGEEYDEITIYDEEIYTGWWAATTSKLVDLPSDEELQQYTKMEVDLLRGCPDGSGGYSDAGCDEYDRIARMFICHGQCSETEYFFDSDSLNCQYSWDSNEGICFNITYFDDQTLDSCGDENWDYDRNCEEISRWITPFGRQPRHLTDISPFISTLRPGGPKLFKFQESGWPNSLLTMKLRLYNETSSEINPKEYQPMWSGTVGFDSDYDENRPPLVFNVPEQVEKIEFVAFITGHGWGNNTCYNCAEFCNSKHIFSLNGGVYDFERAFPNAGSNDYCMSTEAISEGVIPNQGGTWGYGRAGWCPGQDVKPYIVDITDYVEMGSENILDYSACRVSGNSCVTPPSCGTCGYCPEIAFSSYIIYYY